jgi:formylglycine-generating enzyme required for sulfatase activity
MVLIESLGVCIDRYEASPEDNGVPQAGLTPYHKVDGTTALDLCAARQKRLCTASEWTAACGGPAGTPYPYGDTYDPAACNDGGTCHAELAATGSHASCQGGYPGIFDMTGNVWEWTSTCTNNDWCILLGGSYQTAGNACATLDQRAAGAFPTDDLGFRCCLTPQ